MRRGVGVAAVTTAALAALAIAASAAGSNLIANGTFEGSGSGSLSGWAASGGTLSLVAGEGGGYAARVTAGSGVSQTFAYTSTKPVKSTTAGVGYTLDAAIRSDAPGQSVCLKLREQPSGSTANVGFAQTCVSTTTAWQSFPTVGYTTLQSGDVLTVNIVEHSPASAATYDVDNVVLAVAGTDTTPPSVPQGVTATAVSQSSIDVAWSASTDDVGVAGYNVLRDGVQVGTVGGGQTAFQDTGLAASTTYGYTVDAFDAAGNTSQPSSPAAQATTPAGSGGPCGILPPPLLPPVYDHVVVVMDENLGYNGWHGASQAPYTNGLAADCALATNAVGATHPSQPNYIALSSGQLVVWTGSAQHSSADNLFHQLGAAGMGWQALEESMPSACSSSSVFPYKTGHNPPFWFTDLGAAGDGSCARQDVPFSVAGFDASTLPAFTWITPNQCDDMHWQTGCPGTKTTRVQTGDSWLAGLLPAIFASPDYQAGRTLVILTWDEGNESGTTGIDCTAQANIDSTGCHVALLAMSAYITPGTVDPTRYSHYSVLAAVEQMWGLPLLGRAQTATPLGSAMGF